MAHTLRMGRSEWALLLLLSLLWSGSFFFYRILVAELPPLVVVLGRVGIAALLLNAWLLVTRDTPPRSLTLWRQFLVMGLLNNVLPFWLIAFGEIRIGAGLASILNATTPIFTVIAAHFFTTNERATPMRIAGVGCGFAGAVVLLLPSIADRNGVGDTTAEIACLLAAVLYAFAGIYGRRFRYLPPLQVATGQITASSMVLGPAVMIVDRPWELAVPSPMIWAALLGIALFCTALAYIVYFRILASAGATNLLLVTFLLPISAVMLGHFVLGEVITVSSLGGMLLIGVGLAAIDGRPMRKLVSVARYIAYRSASLS